MPSTVLSPRATYSSGTPWSSGNMRVRSAPGPAQPTATIAAASSAMPEIVTGSPARGLFQRAAIPRSVGEGDGAHGRERDADFPIGVEVGAGGAGVADATEGRRHRLGHRPVAVEGAQPLAEAAGLHHRAIERQR